MGEGKGKNEFFRSTHMIILICYTIFSIVLIAESILLHWETWALFLVGIAVVASWVIHIQQVIPPNNRLWIYSIFMMGCAFFYGTHLTSTYDFALVMAGVMIAFTMTGEKALITLCQGTYYATMVYDLVMMYKTGENFDSLVVTRTLLHLAIIAFIGYISRTIIDKWNYVLTGSDEKISILTDATRRMNDFLANMSHEIRTPINAVIGLTGVCIEKETNPEIKTDLRSIEAAGKRVAEQIGDILDHSEIDMQKLAVNSEDYMLSSLLNDLVNQVKPLKTPELELVIDVDPALPSVMHTDVSKLKKIMWHLIANGLKYTKEGGVYVHISRVNESYGINMLIEVTDTGIGMSPLELERITENYYQGNSGRTRSTSGLGLGMTIVSGFVAALNGFMTIESEVGVGTTVRVSIPQKIVDDTECMMIANPNDVSIGAFLHFEKYKNASVREFYGSMLVNIVAGLKTTMHKVETVDNLRKLLANMNLTHLFIGQEEYLTAPDYINSLSNKMLVIVVAEEDFVPPRKSNIRIMRKPFYCFPVVGFLNMTLESKEQEEGKLYCEGVRALVVDDEPMNLTVALGIFRRYGMIVTTAASGRESIELCRKNDYDIVFMDHMMPEMDGVEAMKLIKAQADKMRKDLPVVALTANAVSTAREMFMQEGFDGFVSKPIDLVDLERVLKRVLPKSLYSIIVEEEKEESRIIEKHVTEAIVDNTVNIPGIKEEPETQTNSSSKKDKFLLLKALGFDVDAGLMYSQDDEELYIMIVKQFASESKEKKEKLERFLKAEDMPNYAIIVHALKSTSKLIGNMALSDKAKALEFAAKAGDTEFVKANHDEFMKEYSEITAALYKEYCGGESASSTGTDEIMEFEAYGDDGVMEFDPSETEPQVMEFDAKNDDEIMEFDPKE